MNRVWITGILLAGMLGGPVFAAAIDLDPMSMDQQDLRQLLEQGKEFFQRDISCHVCHGDQAQGLIGPSLRYGPTPAKIYQQLKSNPQMAVIAEELKPDDQDLISVALYIRTLAELPVSTGLAAEFSTGLKAARKQQASDLVFPETRRDLAVDKIQSFDTVLADWQRRSTRGPIGQSYESRVVATFDPGSPRFKPQKDHTYFYENVGNSANLSVLEEGAVNARSTQIVVGDAETYKVLASYELPVALRAAVHTTVMSPDGKYVYIVGAKPNSEPLNQIKALDAPATLIKADAITLQPVKQLTMGGRLHHGQIFRDKYLLLDTFSREPDGLDILLLDPATDRIVGGVRDEDLGGSSYTSWTDNQFIYVLMEPTGYASHRSTGMLGAINLYRGKLTTMRPFWVARIDPDTWEVVNEYPFSGFRGDWVVIDAGKEYMYVTAAGLSSVNKINLLTGEIKWTAASGISPYGANLSADESEIWVANKGETTGHFGRTISVLATDSGRPLATVFSGYEVDHVLLAPNGKEMWATSNGEGRIYVFDVASREKKAVIQMPQNGDPHGLVWVHYDAYGNSAVVRDQGGFHNGINPALGMVLND